MLNYKLLVLDKLIRNFCVKRECRGMAFNTSVLKKLIKILNLK